jgi:aminomuconate-semialdehyde/2-hydroxymuconate-6-semialdehyde dehydrogenase
MDKIQNYIGGELVAPSNGNYIDNYNPSTGEVYSLVPDSEEQDVLNAVAAAKKAFPKWKKTTKLDRANILRKLASLIKDNFEEFVIAESRDNGKPIKVSEHVDIPRSSKNLEYYADEILKFEGEKFSDEGMGENYLEYCPIGPVVSISPWNLPLYLFTWKIAPALAAGNTVVAKPSEVTPMTAYMLTKLCNEAGLPAGVLNVIHGHGHKVGDALTTHKDIKAVSFTGSTATGKIIAKNAGAHMKKYSLEMGGKNPNIIFADCDFDEALSTTMRSSFANQGQICLCGSRIFVERSIYEQFKEGMLEKTKKLRQGDPLEASTQQGAVVSEPHMNKILSFFDIAKEEGGKILIGGNRLDRPGYFIEPTIIENLDPRCRTNQEEIFGPVVTITPFDKEEEVIDWANSTEYGLSGSLWTKDLTKARRVASAIDSGVIWINTWLMRDLRTPFGGMKESGRGREGGTYALKFYSDVKNICINNY